jgi:hypothetical protein
MKTDPNAAIVPGSHAMTYYNPAYLADGPDRQPDR